MTWYLYSGIYKQTQTPQRTDKRIAENFLKIHKTKGRQGGGVGWCGEKWPHYCLKFPCDGEQREVQISFLWWPLIRYEGLICSCNRGSSDYALEKNSSVRGLSSTGTSSVGRWSWPQHCWCSCNILEIGFNFYFALYGVRSWTWKSSSLPNQDILWICDF